MFRRATRPGQCVNSIRSVQTAKKLGWSPFQTSRLTIRSFQPHFKRATLSNACSHRYEQFLTTMRCGICNTDFGAHLEYMLYYVGYFQRFSTVFLVLFVLYRIKTI